MAVGYTSDAEQSVVSGTTLTFTGFAVSGSNPAVVIPVAANTGGNVTIGVSSVVCSAGLTCADQGNGANNGKQIAIVRDGGSDTLAEIWSLAAPSGTGTITVTLSASVADAHANAILLSGAHQTTPMATGDAVTISNATIVDPQSLTASNLTANDASVGIGANAADGDSPSITAGTQTMAIGTTSVNMASGYRLGTGAITSDWVDIGTHSVMAVARVAAASAGNSSSVSPSVSPSASVSPSSSASASSSRSPSPSSSVSSSASPSTAPPAIVSRTVLDYVEYD